MGHAWARLDARGRDGGLRANCTSHRGAARLSLRGLAAKAGIDFGYLGQIERGERRCSPDWAEIIDQALGAKGALLVAVSRRCR